MEAKSKCDWVTIKEMPKELRPRERMQTFGAQALSDGELLALLLRTGTKKETALDLGRKLLSSPQGLRFIVEASLEELKEQKGIGLAKACQLKAAIELGRRLSAYMQEKVVVRTPQDVANLLLDEMRFLDREHFRTVSLNTKNQVLAINTVSVGTLNSSLAHPREVFKDPIRHSAAALVLVHNHPSGDPEPSQEDIMVTRRLVEAGKILGIEVLDHLVLGDGRYTSFKESNLF